MPQFGVSPLRSAITRRPCIACGRIRRYNVQLMLYHASKVGLNRLSTERLLPKRASPTCQKTSCRQSAIPAPPTTAEQRAIAEALGDVDALIGGLDQLIAKKRDLKQAAMQQLLTGQTRLPGFSGEWEVKRLGDIGDITSAGVDKKSRPGRNTGPAGQATSTFIGRTSSPLTT